MAQAGVWDIDDGNGIQPIEDPVLAREFVTLVNELNVKTIVQALVVATLFSALPQSMTQPAAFFFTLYAILYFIRDKIPSSSDV